MILPKNKNIFTGVRSVSAESAQKLHDAGLLNHSGIVVAWSSLNPFLRDELLSEKEAKQLILLELFRTDAPPRVDTINRLLNYMTGIDKRELKHKILHHTSIEL
jgi:hypothetical protein